VSNVLNEEKKQQVIALGRLGWSSRQIQRATGIRRETAAAYLKEAGVPLRPPGGWGHNSKPAIEVITGSGQDEPIPEASATPVPSKPAIRMITDFGAEPEVNTTGAAEPQPGRSPSASACEPHREAIELGLSRGRNAVAIWQDLVDSCGFGAGYQSVRRFIWKLQGNRPPEACAIIETAPGEEAQVDYGEGPMVRDPQSGKYRRTRLFVLTLGYSRKSVRLLVFRSSSQIWAELHEKAFRRLGGVTK
jgi:transposase